MIRHFTGSQCSCRSTAVMLCRSCLLMHIMILAAECWIISMRWNRAYWPLASHDSQTCTYLGNPEQIVAGTTTNTRHLTRHVEFGVNDANVTNCWFHLLMVDATGQDERKRMTSLLSSFNRSMLSVSHRLRSSIHSVICLDASVWSVGGQIYY